MNTVAVTINLPVNTTSHHDYAVAIQSAMIQESNNPIALAALNNLVALVNLAQTYTGQVKETYVVGRGGGAGGSG